MSDGVVAPKEIDANAPFVPHTGAELIEEAKASVENLAKVVDSLKDNYLKYMLQYDLQVLRKLIKEGCGHNAAIVKARLAGRLEALESKEKL